MLRRIPVSLKFDDDESDFYTNFIEQKKNDRELSGLILDLLHVYYENDDVKEIVEKYVIAQNPYLHIQQELNRIAAEHNKNTVTTEILSDFNESSKKNFVDLEKDTHSNSSKPDSSKEDFVVLSKAELNGLVNDSVQSAFLALMGNISSSQEKIQEIVKRPIEKKEEIAIQENVENVDNVVNDVVIETEVKNEDKEVVEIKTSEVKEEVKSPIENTEKEVVAKEEVKKVKPKSFGKLMKSLDG